MIEKDGKQFFVTVTDEFTETCQLEKRIYGKKFETGNWKSEVCFCCYEKNYEQYAKLGVPIEEAPIKNRSGIRLKDERAYYAVRKLLPHYDAEQTAFSIINHYIRFVDRG